MNALKGLHPWFSPSDRQNFPSFQFRFSSEGVEGVFVTCKGQSGQQLPTIVQMNLEAARLTDLFIVILVVVVLQTYPFLQPLTQARMAARPRP